MRAAGWLACAACAGSAAAQSLPPLQVDPTLLGLPARKPAPAPVPAPAQAAAAPAAPAAAAPVAAPPAPAKSDVPPSAATVSTVAPPPAARELPAAAPAGNAAVPTQPAPSPAAPAAQARTPPSLPAPVAAVPAAQPQRAPAMASASGADGPRNLPPLRVDPALLGLTAQAGKSPAAPPVSIETQPPMIAEQPKLPPLYSAHVAAGAIPHPATTPFSATDKQSAPTTVTARRIDGLNDVEAVAEGEAVLERAGDTLSADRIVYRQADDEVEATGNVRLAAPDSVITGSHLRLRLEESVGTLKTPAYSLRHQPAPLEEAAVTLTGLPLTTSGGQALATTGRKIEREPVTGSGVADVLEFRGPDQYALANATYSTCAPGRRDWEVRIDDLDLDYTEGVGTGRGAVVAFKDVPIFYAPWLNFSLNNQRKSGLLPPTIGSTSKNGLEMALPIYWNIAPDMDATFTPRLMARRGVQWNTEFRYLLGLHGGDSLFLPQVDEGQVRLEYLPGDKLAKRDRYGYSITHSQRLADGLSAELKLNGVSDDSYFSDLTTRVGQVSQSNLLRQGTLSYEGAWYNAQLNVQTFQTLQVLPNTYTPYRRLPQLKASAFNYNLPQGLALNVDAEYVNFDHPNFLIGKRTIFHPQLSLPLGNSYFSLTPKLGLHFTRYALDRLDRPGQDNPLLAGWLGAPDQPSRTVPQFSLDASVIMDRNFDWLGQSLVQTLEPRAFYAYVPDRNQSRIPVFDSSLADFNYSQMFSPNRYVGGDRIGDANELTLAVTSRFLASSSGAELLKATVGTRYYFNDQRVTLPGETPRSARSADILATLSGQVLPHTYADAGWQYNPRDSRTERLVLGGRYRPEADKVLNAGYRYARDLLGQIDVSGQWPLAGGWHGVGRYNYSTKERRGIETIGGLEFNAGCWAARFVVQRLATIANKPTTAVFLQLELNDFSRIGSNPLDLLRRSIPGYGVINQPTAAPVFGAL
jgi:LPS-assembly protein